jgi:hypothetical protein
MVTRSPMDHAIGTLCRFESIILVLISQQSCHGICIRGMISRVDPSEHCQLSDSNSRVESVVAVEYWCGQG